MIELTVQQIAGSPRNARVGLLASSAVIAAELYSKAFSAHGIAVVPPAHQEEVMNLIRAVKRGDTGPQAQAALSRIALELAKQADVLLIGCSELSVIAATVTVPFIDSLDLQAEAIVKFAASAA
jgi:aspartate racemase